MDAAKLQALRDAFYTGRPADYRGDLDADILQALDELIKTREQIADVKLLLGFDS